MHAGEQKFRSHNSLTVPIVQTSVYTFRSADDLLNYTEENMFWEEPEREEYGRYGNPTVRAAEAKIASLEHGQDAMLLSSGMGAITCTLLLMLKQGDHLIMADESYLHTLEFGENFLPNYGIECTMVPCHDLGAIEAAIQPNTKLIFMESPTNPFMSCVDFEGLVHIAKTHKLKTVVDTTFATPCNVLPLDYGVDVVIHSVTKYLAGHNDLMAGAVVGNFDVITPLRKAQSLFGNIISPQNAYLILRGIKTLPLRMERHNANGLAIARFLETQPKVRKVWYPGLESHRDYAIAQQTMKGFSGVVSFEIEGDMKRTHCFLNALKIPTIGPSLGGVESLISPLGLMGYAHLEPEERIALGVRDELVRYCIGLEETEDLIADLMQAFAQI
ncbi:MAG: aminotransferase class I/II-fold pyridoxal phosphate-dependent enzyme [Chloroflexota bacterium]